MTPPDDAPFDPYKILQVDPEAEDEVIEAAYRRLARKYHPDVTTDPDAQARMTRINRAWEVLGDPASRAAHDRGRTAHREVGTTGPPPSRPRPHAAEGSASPPPGNASGTVLRFGRYQGWSMGEIARTDLEYLEWLDRMPIGRPYRDEIDALLRRAGRRRSEAAEQQDRRGLFRRR